MVLTAATNGIIGVYQDGSYKPKAYLSRAVVAMVWIPKKFNKK
ncbi:S-layer homology domain-containing protein [Paenibacillus taichungensis]